MVLPIDSSSGIGILPLATATLPTPIAPTTIFTSPQPTSTFSFLPEKFFRQKKFTDDILTDTKTRAGLIYSSNLSLQNLFCNLGVCHSGKEGLIRRGNSHDSPGNSRQSSRKSNPSIHSIHSLHNNGKKASPFEYFLLIIVTFCSCHECN